MARTKNALEILDRLTGRSAHVRQRIANAHINMEVAQMIHDARTEAGLSQRELAQLIGSRQPVIARLEDADYRGHSLTMLQRIGNALGRQLELRFVQVSRRGPRRSGDSARQRKASLRA